MDYFVHVLVFFFIYSLVVFGLSYTTHAAGILTLGQAAFFGIGAYSAALLGIHTNVGFLSAAVIGGAIALLSSTFIGVCALRLKEDYLAIATLAFLEVVRQLFYNWNGLTHGAYGLANIPPANIFGFQMIRNSSYLVVAVILCAIGAAIIVRINRTPLGLAVLASRDDLIALETLGKSATLLKLGTLSVSAFLAGIAGAEYAYYVGFIHPNDFGLNQSIMFLAISIVATARRPILGCFLGLLVYFVSSEMLRVVNLPGTYKANVIQILTAVTILLVVLFRERGTKS